VREYVESTAGRQVAKRKGDLFNFACRTFDRIAGGRTLPGFDRHGRSGERTAAVVPAGAGGPKSLPSKPTFRAGPAAAGYVLAIGFVRGPASTGAVTMSGVTKTAGVVALDGDIGGYAVWLPTAANTPATWSAISKVVAEDSHGRVIATLS
jgi:hypothetical protein